MKMLPGSRALVVGRDSGADAAAALLERRGVVVRRADGGETSAGGEAAGGEGPELVVLGTATVGLPPLARFWKERGVPVIGERELAFRESYCLHVAVAGAGGKSTTVNLIARLLQDAGRRVAVAGGAEAPASALAEGTRDLDLMVHRVEACEFEHLDYFRPVVAVLLNAPAEYPEAGEGRDAALRRVSRLFARQQPFDWAVIQTEALAQLKALGIELPGKVITFSAASRQADLGVERGLLVSRWEGWAGRLWDMGRGQLQGPHLAEDALAALAVGRVLRLTLDEMTHALDGYRPAAGCCEILGSADGVRWVDDGRSAHLDALAKALLTLAPAPPETPNIWLIAGGALAGRQFYDLGPLLSPRVKQALVYGEAAQAMRAAWSLFTPCSPVPSLLDAANRVLEQATRGDTILFSPACPRPEGPEYPSSERGAFRRVADRHLGRSKGGPDQ
ncbi:MAG: hypothetical protein KF833_06965 [Verrucomicrobiae bacterium]|nr:hypothetical protein [Verrucomicrobiae bacterium]